MSAEVLPCKNEVTLAFIVLNEFKILDIVRLLEGSACLNVTDFLVRFGAARDVEVITDQLAACIIAFAWALYGRRLVGIGCCRLLLGAG